MNGGFLKWLKTALIAAVGGGIAGASAAAMNPAEYKFPQDLGSGKLWVFFLMGAGTTLVALLLKSPLGQQATTAFKDSQQQLQESQAEIKDAKAELKSAVQPEPPPTGPPPPKK
jgi:hypothetical protein